MQEKRTQQAGLDRDMATPEKNIPKFSFLLNLTSNIKIKGDLCNSMDSDVVCNLQSKEGD